MTNFSKIPVSSFYLLHLLAIHVNCEGLSGWGPYEVVPESVVSCSGPKPINLTAMHLRLEINPKTGRGYLYGNCTVKPGGPLAMRVRAFKWVDKKFQSILTVNGNCSTSPLMKKFVLEKTHLMDTRCYLKPGYQDVKFDVTELANNFWGTSFFFGKYKLLISAFTPKANILCYVAIINYVDKLKLEAFMATYNKNLKNQMS